MKKNFSYLVAPTSAIKQILANHEIATGCNVHVANSETEQAIQGAKDIISGKIQTKSYRSAQELFQELDAE